MMKKNSELVCGGNSEDSKLEKNLKNELSASDSDGSRPAGQTADCIKGMCLTELTLYNGSKKLGHGKSLFVITILYTSHFFSAWGDRMWAFAVTLFLLRLFPESLLLMGVYGLIMQLGVVVFGTIVGHWVDTNSRLRVVAVSLLVQNSLVAICSIVLAVAFHDHFNISYCKDVGQFFLVACVVVVMGTLANLATIANTISIEKDWVVVIADKNKNILATLNAWMRRIDLCCKLMAPVLVGAVITYTDYFTSTLFVAGWNVMSYFAEFGLLCIVYYYVPALANKKIRKHSLMTGNSEDQREKHKEEKGIPSKSLKEGEDKNVFVSQSHKSKSCKQNFTSVLSKLVTPYITIRDGWKIYARQEIARAGVAMSLLYITVLGFSGVTAAYFKIQGLTEVMIGVFQGVGGIIAIIGTFVYVPLRRRVGTVRAGLFGMCAQFIMLLFCVAAVFAPGNQIETGGEDYYSPYCPSQMGGNTSSNNITVNMSVNPSQTITSLPSISVTSTYFVNSTITLNPSPLPTQYTNSRISNSTYSIPSYSHSYPHSNTSTGANSTRNDNSESKNPYTVSLVLLLIGVLGARFGLWMFDLSLSQLLQEKVKEEERGVVSGVMNVFIANNDMLHYLLAIAAPDPKYFGILTLISVMFVGCGLLLYASYVHKVRGHLFHIADFYRRIKYDLESHRKLEHMTRPVNENDDDKEMKDDDSTEENPDLSGNL